MTSKKAPSDTDTTPPPRTGDDSASPGTSNAQPVEAVLEALADAARKVDREAIKQQVTTASTAAQRAVRNIERTREEPPEDQQKAAIAGIAELLGTVLQAGAEVGKELQKASGPLVEKFRAEDAQTFAAGLQQLLGQLQKPENVEQARALLKQLANKLAPRDADDDDDDAPNKN